MTLAELKALMDAGEPIALVGSMSGKAHRVSGEKPRASRPRGPKGGERCAKNPKKPTASPGLNDTPCRKPQEARSSTKPYLPIPPIAYLIGMAAAIIWRWLLL